MPTYLAQYVIGTDDLDIAVVKVVGMIDPNQSLPTNLPLSPNRLGNSSAV